MTKTVNSAEEDAALNYIAASTRMCVCNAQPLTYTNAITDYMLAYVAMTAGAGNGDYTLANDSSGRKLTTTAKSGVSITNSGTATYIALVSVGDTTLRAVTTCTSQALVAGGTVDIPAFKFNVQDPT